MLLCYKVIVVDGGFNLALKCAGDGFVSGFKSPMEDEEGSSIKHSEEEAASLWRSYACICDGNCDRW